MFRVNLLNHDVDVEVIGIAMDYADALIIVESELSATQIGVDLQEIQHSMLIDCRLDRKSQAQSAEVPRGAHGMRRRLLGKLRFLIPGYLHKCA